MPDHRSTTALPPHVLERQDMRDAIGRIDGAARRMTQLTRQLLAFAGRGRFVTALLDLSPPIAQAVDLARAFSTMIKQSLADQLDGWIAAAENGGFKGFAGSLRQDRDAVHAALTLPWSTGPVEGQINRLKVIKRSMYGRAGFNLLRHRVLAAA